MNIGWIAIEDGDEAWLLDQLGLEPVGASTHELSRQRACRRLPSGWLVLTANDWDFKSEEVLGRLSPKGLALACSLYETVMYSQIKAMRDGRPLWSAAHDCEKGLTSLEIEGEPPPLLQEIRRRLQAEQEEARDGVDMMFDAPPELSEALCGYRPDHGADVVWTLLRPVSARGGEDGARRLAQMSRAMQDALVPLLASLGWSFGTDPPDLVTPWKIRRTPGDTRQSIFFEFTIDPEPWIGMTLRVDETVSAGGGRGFRLETRTTVVKESFWTRLTGRGRAPPPADPVAAAIDGAKADIEAAEDHLRTGRTPDRLSLETFRWQEMPADA